MITSAETLQRLDMARATSSGPCQLGGDAGIVKDLEELRRREGAVDRTLAAAKISCICGAEPTTEDPETGAARCQACVGAIAPKFNRNDDAYLDPEHL
jgi:hypothetical protein